MNVYYGKTLGRYNFADPSEKQWQLYLYTSFGNFSETFPADEEPETEDCLPSEILDLIEARLKKYLISTRREETLAKMAVVREHASEIDVAWLTKRIDEAEERVKYLKGRLEEITEPA